MRAAFSGSAISSMAWYDWITSSCACASAARVRIFSLRVAALRLYASSWLSIVDRMRKRLRRFIAIAAAGQSVCGLPLQLCKPALYFCVALAHGLVTEQEVLRLKLQHFKRFQVCLEEGRRRCREASAWSTRRVGESDSSARARARANGRMVQVGSNYGAWRLNHLVRLHLRIISGIAHRHIADEFTQHGRIASPLQRCHVRTRQSVLAKRVGGAGGGGGGVGGASRNEALACMSVQVWFQVVLTQSIRELARSKWKLSGADTVLLAFLLDAMPAAASASPERKPDGGRETVVRWPMGHARKATKGVTF